MSEIQLPEGWVWKRLSEVSDILMGQSPASESYNDSGKGLPFFQGKAEFTSIHPVVRKWCTDPTRVAESGDILLSVRAPVGPTNVADQRCCIGRGLAAIRGKYVNQQYLYWYFKGIQRKLEGQGTGSTFGAISKKEVWEIPIPLPPFPIQQAIVAQIEELFSELEAGVQELKTALVRLKMYRQAVLHHYLNNPAWKRVKLGEVAKIVVGYVGPISEYLSTALAGVPLLSTTHIGVNKFVDNDIRFVDLGFAVANKKSLVNPGHIIIARHGDSGKSCIVPDVYPQYQVSNAVIARVKPEMALNKFVCYFLNYQREVLQENRVGAVFQVVNTKIMSSFPIPLPNLTTQNQIVSEVEAQLSEADSMEILIRQELIRAENLRQSILKRAFAGQLVTAHIIQSEREKLAGVAEPAVAHYGGQGDQLTLF